MLPTVGAPGPLPSPGTAGLVDEVRWQAAVSDYLRFATDRLDASNPVSIALHQLRSAREASAPRAAEPSPQDPSATPSWTWDPTAVDELALRETWTKLDSWADTGDFTLMHLHWVRALDIRAAALATPRLDDAVIAAIERRMLEFRYRYDDPLPPDRVDDKWFWSENHRLIFAVDEYLSGRALPEETFAVTGMSGEQHADRARPTILSWIRERGRYGFSEWHSNVYLPLDINPLLTLIELCPDDDVALQRAAAGALDLCLVDLAAHLHRGVFGATRGRSYEKDKMTARDENTFTVARLLFDDTVLADGSDVGWVSTADGGCLGFAATDRYRLPELIRRIACSERTGTVVERHGLPLDPTAPVTPWPEPVDGHGFDVSELPFWWSQGAMTAWQVLPATLAVADRYRLWDTTLFRPYRAMRVLSNQPAVTQLAARELAAVTAAGLLGEACTVTWRSPEVMLSTVVDHRAGMAMEQSHAWQATVDADALVFGTHPSGEPGTDGRGEDSGYWTGSASMPRSAQHDRVSIHCYLPGYEPIDLDALGFSVGYLPLTHVFFPRERFDEVVDAPGTTGNWTIGRRGDGFVAVWSHRATEWRQGPLISSATFTEPFDLVAPGDARNVWICEVARASEWTARARPAVPAQPGSPFDSFVAAVLASPVSAELDVGGWTVAYESPSAGSVSFGTQGPLTVDGVEVALRGGPRHRSAWGEICHLQESLELVDPDSGARLAVDFATGARELR